LFLRLCKSNDRAIVSSTASCETGAISVFDAIGNYFPKSERIYSIAKYEYVSAASFAVTNAPSRISSKLGPLR